MQGIGIIDIKKYIYEYRNVIIGVFAFTIFCFWCMLTHDTVNIDEETCLFSAAFNNGWLEINRYSNWLYERIFTDRGRYVPFFTDIVGIILWNLSGTIFGYAFIQKLDMCKANKIFAFFALAYYSTIPFCVGESFGFTMMIIPVAGAMVITAISFLLTLSFADDKKWYKMLAIIALMTLALGVYQTMLNVYATAVVGYCLFETLVSKDDEYGKRCRKVIWWGIVTAVIATGLYFVINKIIMSLIDTTTYLSDTYVGWKDGNILQCLYKTVMNVIIISFGITGRGVDIFGASVIRIVTLMFAISAIYNMFKVKKVSRKIFVFIWQIAVCVAPFALFVLMGSFKTPGRALLGLSLAGMLEILVVAYCCKGVYKYMYIVIMAFVLLANASNMNLVYYSNYLSYTHDVQVAEAMIRDIRSVCNAPEGKALVTIGEVRYESPLATSGTLGGSFFDWDNGNIRRITNFLRMKGLSMDRPTNEQLDYGFSIRNQMNVWPKEGSIVETEDSVIIYLSEPGYYWHDVNYDQVN